MTAKAVYVLVFLLLAAAGTVLSGLGGAVRDGLIRRAEKQSKVRSFRKPKKSAALLRKLSDRRRSLAASSGVPEAARHAVSAACAAGGFLAGRIVYRSLLISVSVGALCTFLPLLVFSLRRNRAALAGLERLCSSMMILSNSYLVTEDFQTAVRDNLDIIESPGPFRDFLAYASLTDADVRSALRRMERQVGNAYFSQWIDALVLAQDDRSLKYVTVAVVDSMHDVIEAQQESDAAMYAVWRDYALTLVLIFSVPLIFKMLMNEAYLALTASPGGQVLFMLLLAAVVYSVLRAVRINRPVMN